MKWLINYDCAHWCGGDSKCVVEAETEDEAVILAEDFMNTEMRELFSDEYNDQSDEDSYEDFSDEQAYNVISVEPFDEAHEEWVFYKDSEQSQFYPEIE